MSVLRYALVEDPDEYLEQSQHTHTESVWTSFCLPFQTRDSEGGTHA